MVTDSRLDQLIDPPIVIESGKSSDVLVIGFAGFGGWLATHPVHFYNVASLLKYARIMLRDPSRTCYLSGIPPVAEGYRALLELLRSAIERLAPKKVLAMGTSGGGTAALLFGHALEVDYVHAFAPFTYADEANLERHQDRELRAVHRRVLERLYALPGETRALLDVSGVLARDNGKTRYYVHYCEGRPTDAMRADHISRCPNVHLLGYPCAVHQVAESLAQKQFLDFILNPENQANLPQLVAQRRQRKPPARTARVDRRRTEP